MNNELRNMVSVCIFGKNCASELKGSIRNARELTDAVVFIDLGSDDQGKRKVSNLGIQVVDLASLPSVLQSEWVLFVRPCEVPVLTSESTLYSMLNDEQKKGYLVYSKGNTVENLLENYQLIRNLGQYDKIGETAYVTRVEPRLARKSHAGQCLESLIGEGSESTPSFFREIVGGLTIKSISEDKSKTENEPEEHDKRCLAGEVFYDPLPGEGMDELSSGYIGFRVLHKGYLDSLMEGARRGFGTDQMYLMMLAYLNQDGSFAEARDLFEVWMANRDGKEDSLDLQMMGGLIYSHLFLLDEAITWYEKAAKMSDSELACTNAGKLYLIKGEKEKAIKYLRKSIDMRPDPFHAKILSVIEETSWRPQTLSLCMIAKDEENSIRNALVSMENIADEIVVVDTGSSDRTKDIVREYGGKVIQTKWRDDFSAVRNLALQNAHCDYILFLDADELIDVRDRVGLALLKKILPIDQDMAFRVRIEPNKPRESMSVSMENKLSTEGSIAYQVRLFPRREGIKFEGGAFESVDKSLERRGMQLTQSQLFKIVHETEESEFRDKRKVGAVRKLFASVDDPAKALEGGVFFLKLGDLDQAYGWIEKTDKPDPKLLSRIATLYMRHDQDDRAKEIIRKGLQHFPESYELNLVLSKIYYKEKKYSKVRDVLSSRIHEIRKNFDPEWAAEASYYYGIALLESDLLPEAIDSIAYASEKSPLDIRFKLAGLYTFSKADRWEEALELLQQIVHEERIRVDQEIRDFADMGLVFVELGKHFAGSGKSEEANICQKILEYIIDTKISRKEEVERMTRILHGTNRAST